MTSWWRNASTEQRLAQIDGGIECGLTARQVALASGGTTPNAVTLFANYHGRSLGRGRPLATRKRDGSLRHDRAQFIRGNAVDFWSHEAPQPNDELQEMVF